MSDIKFGNKFSNWSTLEQIEYLKKLTSSQNQALDQMQQERDALLARGDVLKQDVANAQSALDIQKRINQVALTKQNEDAQHSGERIQELQARLRNGNQHNMDN